MMPYSDDLIDLCEDLVFTLDTGGRFVKLNRLASLNLEYEPEELAGKHFYTILDEHEYQNAAEHLSNLLQGDQKAEFDTVFKTRLGSRLSYRVIFRSLSNGNEKNFIGGIAKSTAAKNRTDEKIRDLEARLIEASRLISIERARWKQDKSLLEELNKLKSEFISNISHELRTPLASIIGFSETILSDPEMSPGMRDEFNNIILTEGKRLARLINEILEISRMESGKISLIKSDMDLTALLKESVENNLDLIRKKNLNFTFEHQPEEIIISGDREKLLNVFDGLLNNAVKFTPREGRIKLILHKMNREAEIIISDTGVGIPERDLPQIFQKFMSINRADTDIPDSGLGLVFVKQIIDLHKGLITVHSEVNKGTTFVIKLPYKNKAEGNQ